MNVSATKCSSNCYCPGFNNKVLHYSIDIVKQTENIMDMGGGNEMVSVAIHPCM